MENKLTHFELLKKANIKDKIEKKGNLDYLSWAYAWGIVKAQFPMANYEIKKFENNLPYVFDKNVGYMVFTSVTIENITHEMWLPVMDHRNKTLMTPTMFDVNKTIMRCLTKNLAMFGLGLCLYTGEDLPEAEQSSKQNSSSSKTEEPETKIIRGTIQAIEKKEGQKGRVLAITVFSTDMKETKTKIYIFEKNLKTTIDIGTEIKATIGLINGNWWVRNSELEEQIKN